MNTTENILNYKPKQIIDKYWRSIYLTQLILNKLEKRIHPLEMEKFYFQILLKGEGYDKDGKPFEHDIINFVNEVLSEPKNKRNFK